MIIVFLVYNFPVRLQLTHLIQKEVYPKMPEIPFHTCRIVILNKDVLTNSSFLHQRQDRYSHLR